MALNTNTYGYVIDPLFSFCDQGGKTIANGYVRVFLAGTSTPVLTYRNFDGAFNAETIELDNSGRTAYPVIGSKGITYKVCVYDAEHSQEDPILTVDKVAVIGASVSAKNIVTGLDNVTVQEENFLKATVEGTSVELALDPTEVTSDVNTISAAETAAPDYVLPLLDKTGTGDGKKISLANLFKFALDWISRLATTVTSFASGDFIAVSNTTNGARKMSKDTLLELTAQNALAGNVAKAFDESGNTTYKAGTPISRNGKTYIFKVDHSGIWSDSDVKQIDSTEFFKSTECKVSDASIFVASKENVGVPVDIFPHYRTAWEQGSFDNRGNETTTTLRLRTIDYVMLPKRRFATSQDYIQKIVVNVNTPNVQVDVLWFKDNGTYRNHSNYLTGTNNVLDFSSDNGEVTKIRILVQADIAAPSRTENVVEIEGVDISIIPYESFVSYQDKFDESARDSILSLEADLISKNPLFWVQGGEGSNGAYRTYANSRIGLWYVPITSKKISFVVGNSGNSFNAFFYDSSKNYVSKLSSGWVNSNTEFTPASSCKYMTIIVRKDDNSAINTDDIANVKIYASYSKEDSEITTNLKLMSFNLGHFDYGLDYGIPAADYAQKSINWKKFLCENSCDIIGLQECSTKFDKANTISSMSIFSPIYKNDVGIDNWSRVKANFSLSNFESITFSTGRGYSLKCDCDVNGKAVKIFNVHLTPGKTAAAISARATEMSELIADMANYTRVICFGDFNAFPISDYDPFVLAGYTIANGGYLPSLWTITDDSSHFADWPTATATDYYPDNIIVSSNIKIKNFFVLNSYADLTSDHLPVFIEVAI